MKKTLLTAALCAALTATAPMQGHAGSTMSTSSSSGGSSSDAAVIVLIVALGALIFGTRNNTRTRGPVKATKSPDSQF
ncbi:MAG: hypothetical protein AAF601_10995 [Pseudomonadota bacterium]